jgi:hypothetical protein
MDLTGTVTTFDATVSTALPIATPLKDTLSCRLSEQPSLGGPDDHTRNAWTLLVATLECAPKIPEFR